jgi:hypothetical protein
MEYSLSYRTTRAEAWRWYLRTWRSKLWVFHAALSLAIAGIVNSRVLPDSNLVVLLFMATALFALVFALSAAHSQLMFKAAERQVTLNEAGWSTRIGSRSGSGSWAEIESVDDRPDGLALVPRRGGKALVVPSRALANPERWHRFAADVKEWHHASTL